jgi:hypothetical protein
MYSNPQNRQTLINFDAFEDFRGSSQSTTRQHEHLADDETPSLYGSDFNPAAGSPRRFSSGTYRTNSATSLAALRHRTEATLFVKHQSLDISKRSIYINSYLLPSPLT